MTGTIRAGIGGWTFEPWRGGPFYPDTLKRKDELKYASSKLTSIEINGTYYSTFKPNSWQKWRDETPRRLRVRGQGQPVLHQPARAVRKQRLDGEVPVPGAGGTGAKLGPINSQFMAAKKFDPVDFEGFLKLLPKEIGGRPARHALEVRSPTFAHPGILRPGRQVRRGHRLRRR